MIVMMVIAYFGMSTNSIENLLGAAFIIYIGFFTIYDTRLIISAGRHNLTPKDYVFASLTLHLDIILIPFEFLLSCLKKCCCSCCKKRDDKPKAPPS